MSSASEKLCSHTIVVGGSPGLREHRAPRKGTASPWKPGRESCGVSADCADCAALGRPPFSSCRRDRRFGDGGMPVRKLDRENDGRSDCNTSVPLARAAGGVSHANAARCSRSRGSSLRTVAAAVRRPPRRTACAIVPLYPKDEVPANDANERPKTVACVGSSMLPPPCALPPELPPPLLPARAATSGFSTHKCALPAAAPCPRIITHRSSPACPDGASVWPTHALVAPTSTPAEPEGGTSTVAAEASAPASVGSPSAVPVPCASSAPSACGDAIPASAEHASNSARCAEPFGAVKLALRPS